MDSENKYQFDLPANQQSIIKVMGVGGGGSNAVSHMQKQGIKGVEFIVCNTDQQALENNIVSNKLQIGITLTEGLGAGADPIKGREAALENKEEIRNLLESNTKMLFITAGMGGGTGTGASPVIAQIAKELNILTVGIVTLPFSFEMKDTCAEEGVSELRKHCDCVLIILNNKIKEMYGQLPMSEAFAKADNVLATAAKGIAEIITLPGTINVDFEDVKTVMKDAGCAVMGVSKTMGENRARKAVEDALICPLLNQQSIFGAKKILFFITSGEKGEIQMDEFTEIANYIKEYAGEEAQVIFGHGIDNSLNENIQVTVIATGFDSNKKDQKVVDLASQIEVKKDVSNQTYETSKTYDTENLEKSSEMKVKEWTYPADKKTEYMNLNSITSQIKKEIEDEDKEIQKSNLEKEKHESKKSFHEKHESKHQKNKKHTHVNEILENKNWEKLREPTYKRNKVTLEEVPHSSERHLSNLNITKENKVLGNNRYLHDNVD